MPSRRLVAFAWAILASGLCLAAAAEPIRFETNDAHVRDRAIEGVKILVATEARGEAVATAETDEAGTAVLDLEPGTYWISYVRSGYVPIGDSETEIRGAGQVVTTTLSMLLEAEGSGARRRVRLVLNWGSLESNVRDADAHAYCVCGRSDAHVYFADMKHENLGHVVELDVDDRDWGGPETITLSDPEPGSYPYWVHQYSQDDDPLGLSDVVVRVFFDDLLEGEFRIPRGHAGRTWKPFREVVIDADSTPRLVRFTADELAAGAALKPPPDPLSEEGAGSGLGPWISGCLAIAALAFLVFFGVVAKRLRR